MQTVLKPKKVVSNKSLVHCTLVQLQLFILLLTVLTANMYLLVLLLLSFLEAPMS